MRNIILIFIAIFALTLSGCNKLRPYQVDIQQGNIIDHAMRDKLRLGMNKKEVATLLGTPILGDMFDDNTWIYVSTMQKDGGKIEKKKLILEFQNNQLIYIK